MEFSRKIFRYFDNATFWWRSGFRNSLNFAVALLIEFKSFKDAYERCTQEWAVIDIFHIPTERRP